MKNLFISIELYEISRLRSRLHKRKILRLRAKRQLKINLRNKLKLYKKRNNSRHRAMQRNAPNTSSRAE